MRVLCRLWGAALDLIRIPFGRDWRASSAQADAKTRRSQRCAASVEIKLNRSYLARIGMRLSVPSKRKDDM
jgi:hypothetical protein